MRSTWFVVLLSACTPTHLLEATTTFSQSMDEATLGMSAAPDVLVSLCRDSAAADYLEATFEQPQSAFEIYYASVPRGSGTWRQKCNAYRNSNLVFALYVRALGAYATALGSFAGDESDLGPPLGGSIDAIGKAVAADASSFAYAADLAKVGGPIGRIASAAETYWKAKQLRSVVTARDADVAVVVAALDQYLTNIRRTELRRAHRQLEIFTKIIADHPEVPRLVSALAQIQLQSRLREAERRLDALHALLQDVAAAHHDLADGWKRGECAGADTKLRIEILVRRMKVDFEQLTLPVLGIDG